MRHLSTIKALLFAVHWMLLLLIHFVPAVSQLKNHVLSFNIFVHLSIVKLIEAGNEELSAKGLEDFRLDKRQAVA